MTAPRNGDAPSANQGHPTAVIDLSATESSLPDPDPAALVDGVYVVVVHSRAEGRSPRWTRRIYMSLHAADKARSRAAMRGDRAYLVLCQLQAVDTRLGGAL